MKKNLLLFYLLFISIGLQAQTNGDWRSHGPSDFPPHLNWQLSGVARISQMKFHPTDPNTLYAVNAMGGLFISYDKGANWVSTGADNLPQTRCASVCIDHSNPQVIYLGTGDPSYYSNGQGIWKSTDGGFSWNRTSNGIDNRMAVEILMPGNSGSLIAATNDGIWKSTDGGANWTVKKAGGQFTDMVFQAGSNDVMFACTMNEFWRSTNKGETWTKINLPGNGIERGGRVAVTKANPNIVYLTYVGNQGGGTATPVLKSTDGGNSFFVVKAAGGTNLNGYDANSGGQGNYNYAMSVSPKDPNLLFIVGHIIWKSTNGGANWSTVSKDWAHQVHTDMRQVPFSPFVDNEVYNINDGGIWRSWDNGESWLPICNGLVGTESYIGCQSPVKKDAISIGAQDNGEFVYRDGIWYINGAGDYHSNIIHDNLSADYYYDLSGSGRRRGLPYAGSSSLNLPFDAGNGQNVFTDFPLTNTQTAYIGYKDVYRSTNISNNPPTWTQITYNNTQIKAIASSPTDANVVYVVTEDSRIRRSDNALSGSPTWVTYNTPAATNVTASVVVMKNNTNVVYLICNNRVYRSGNKGANWTDITSNLPGVNYHKILHDNYSSNEAVYVAGFNSVFYKDNTMTNWVNFSKGLPTVVNFRRIYMYNDGTENSELTIITAGRGVWHTGLYGKKPVLREPENPQDVISGIVYKYYEGTWDYLPNFNSLNPVKSGWTSVPDLTPKLRNEEFGLTFHGYIDVPADGKYTFYTTSDDGSRFLIGNEVVVNNDGIHGDIERSGYIWLKKGKHIFTLTHFQKLGGLGLSFRWEGPGISKQLVPANVLYRLSPMSECPENGTISVERWNGISGTLVSSIPVGNTPSLTFTNPNFESKTDDGDNYGVRYRGYICPPYTGNYTFYLASDDNSELWLSTSGDPSAKVRIAYQTGAVNIRNWYKNASQKSASIYLKAGQKYYVEALHKEGGGEDHFAVAWNMPSGEFQAPINGRHLSPFKNNVFPTISITAPANNHAVLTGSNISVTANAGDADGSVTKVEFYLDDIKVSEDNTSPYAWAWNSVKEGVYKLTARAYDNNGGVTVSNVVTVTAVPLRDPENPALTKSSLDYKYYEFSGDVSLLPDYPTLTAKKSGTVPSFTIDIRDRDDRYGIAYSGFIDIPQDGVYTFYLASDDGGKLYFGDRSKLLISNDGIHGMSPEKYAVIGLKKGKHKIMLDLFQNVGGQGLTVSYSGQGIAKQVIPSSVLYREIFSNNPPAISLSSNSTTGTALASFTLTANATDSDGTIAKVEFYSNGSLLTTDSNAPFLYSWTNVAAGTYTLEARAYDDNNAMTVSNSVSITVEVPNVAPSVTLTSDATTGTAPASFTFTATATDTDGTIAKVEFYKNGELLHSDLNSPYTYNWTNVVAGNYSITAKAYDNDNGVATSNAINITVDVPPNVPPTVSISSNVTSGVAPANFILTANASDADGSVTKVEFYKDAVLLTTDSGSPFEYNWTNVAAGTYSVTARAYDDDNDYTTSNAITIVVEVPNANPTVTLTSNATTGIAPANFTFTASATDSDGNIKKVEFYQNDVLITSNLNPPYTWTLSDLPAGTYTIKAKAIDDEDGFDFSNEIIITVEEPNQLPAVSIISPEDVSSFVSPATISMEVNASDPDGSIDKVVLYNGSVILEELTTSPYTYTWTNVSSGTYTITARAYDDDGEYQTSSAITITVETPTSVKESDILVDNTIAVYPNPVYADANVVFEVKQSCLVKMVLTDMSGREIKVMQEKNYVPGHYTETFSFYDLADGDYLLNTTLNNQYFITKIRKGSKPKNVDKD